MSSQYISARENYKPSRKTRILLIAESPPASGGYFYFERATGRDSLFRETMKALRLFPVEERMQKGLDKRPLLKEFQARGYFVLDTSYEPVNKLSRKERRRAIIAGISDLMTYVQKLNPDGIVIVKANIFDFVKDALTRIGFEKKILNKKALPYPSHGHQKIYRTMLRELLALSVGDEQGSSAR